MVFVLVLMYFAVAYGAGPQAAYDAYPVPTPIWVEQAFQSLLSATAEVFGRPAPEAASRPFALQLRVHEALAILGAIAALPDAAWRSARTATDRALSALAMVAALAGPAVEPALLSPGYVILAALAVGDCVAALGLRRKARRLGGAP
ncbi:MAG: hypothetical protein AAFR16_01450 [Pseudomonadota bacterium]